MKIDELDWALREKLRKWEKREKDEDQFKVVEEVFDTATVKTILELIRRRVLRRLNGVISAGKESRVYLAYSPLNEPLAVKIYLTSTTEFKRGIYKYIVGDPRFEKIAFKDTRSLITAWAHKEFRNLKRMFMANVKVPKPIACLSNVLVMEFLGENTYRYPLLVEVYRDLTEDELRQVFQLVSSELEKIVCNAELVHGDYSEYNIMVKPNLDIAIIDVSQAVELSHPRALEFLNRDVENIYRFFVKEAKLDVQREDLKGRIEPCLRKKGISF
ncbi:MAG: serine protein kinase RIO [Desulfurococcaceae archaeon]|jgi:RIO kinase 1|nr:serine protein kinase RIO [Desulfurococcaceae archaeon]